MDEEKVKTAPLEWEFTSGNLVFSLRQLTTREKTRAIKITGGGVDINEEKLFEYGVESISGKIGEKEIKTAKDFLDTPGGFAVFSEVLAEILDKNRVYEEQLKNS